ncbi:murein biosynthesis integral membrane protein MurJ [Actinomadura roseirufa]|uniref:murein biosynthesis integral membrane protein MurJ n=1 Tax=Actinomadura roseirufa TaxID=2094049 RepID=UPI0010414079|nr:murein biosynthesis integral membrane protein MurJ [Actinomadura roseirufa]
MQEHTRDDERRPDRDRAAGDVPRPGPGGAPPGLARAGAVMAAGTVASRLTGFVRTLAVGSALGTALLGDAYQTAEMIPYTVYELLLGGLLAGVLVPFLVRRRMRDADGGEAIERRLLGAALPALAVLTVLAVLAADRLTSLYAGDYTGRQREVTVLLTRLLLVQVFFIGVSGLAGTMLTVRRRFAAAVWAPVANNLITAAAAGAFLWVAGRGRTTATVTDAQLTVLGVGSVLGTLVQTALLVWTLRSAGFRWRPRMDLRGAGLREPARTTGWMLLYVAVAQAGVLVIANVASRAGARAAAAGHPEGGGLAAYKLALVLFQLPHAVVAVSLITALLPRMSAHAAGGRRDLVRADLSRGLRLACALLVPLSLGMLVFAVPGSVALFSYGSVTPDAARRVGAVLAVFALMVVPFTVHQLLTRVLHALGDTRSAGLIAVPAGIAQAVAAVLLLRCVPPSDVVTWLPAASGLFSAVGAAGAFLVLRRRLGGADGRRIAATLTRLHVAALPALAFAAAVVWGFGRMPGERLPGVLAVLVGGLGGAVLYFAVGRVMGVPELAHLTAMARGRLRRRPAGVSAAGGRARS